MVSLPTGTVTFLFTDIEGSTRLLHQLSEGFVEVLDAHNQLIREATAAHAGTEISTEGDAFFCVFETAPDAVAAAVAAQRALASYPWPEDGRVRVRMGMHAGAATLGGDNYVGLEVHRAARIASAAHGGQVLISEATRSLIQDQMPADTGIRDLGQHRLKDLSRREHLYQLVIDGLDNSFPALRTLDATPNNLPVQLNRFIGRSLEMAELCSLIVDNRLVTLRGPGGVGKTRLAVEAAAGLVDEFPDGIWLVDLSTTDDPELVTTIVAETLEVRDMGGLGGRPLSEVLTDYVSDQRMLLVLDNCEHVLDASSQLIAMLLGGGDQLHIATTSRDALNVPGARYNVPSLQHEGGDGDSEAVRLFVDRAIQANADFMVEGTDVEPIAEITRRLDGLPLAIELAAARTNVLTPQQILDRLEDRFALLKVSRTGAPHRQETLLATMDWSYDLLREPEREALQRLSVFSGWTLEAAEAVLGKSVDAIDLLGSLADRSLVEVNAQDGRNRFRFLETVRQYAFAKLVESGTAHSAQSAHAQYFLTLTEAGDKGVRGPDQADWIQRLKAENDNVRAAIGWAMEAGDSDLGLRLVAAMSWYWFIDGYWQGPLQLFRRVYDEATDADPLLRARAVYKAGGIAIIWGWFEEMTPLIEQAYLTLLEVGDELDIAYATHFLGDIHAGRGDADAGELLEASIQMFGQAGDDWGKAFAQRWMGSAVELSGDAARTIDHQRASVAAFIHIGDRWAASWIAFVLGFNLIAIDELEEAAESLEQSLELVEGVEDHLVLPHAKRGLAMVAARSDRPELARSILDDALPLYRRIGDESCIAICHLILGELDTDSGDHAAAEGHLLTSLDGFLMLGNQVNLAPVLRRSAELATAANNHQRAATLAGAAEMIRESAGGVLSAHDRDRFEEARALTETALGEEEFGLLVDRGAGMSLEDVIEYARAV
jgi:predicted ATPase/class 3 adenylate cyclase